MQVKKTITKNLNTSEIFVLKKLFDFIIPPSSERSMPGASFLCEKDNFFSNEDHSLYRKLINQLLYLSLSMHEKKFSQLNNYEITTVIHKMRKELIKEFNKLAFLVLRYYYTNKKVLDLIGVGSIPPFPDGNIIPEGDLLLFEQVYIKGKIYRE